MNTFDQDPVYLIQQARSGDTEAFGKLYEQFLVPVYRYIYLRISHKPTAEDLTQVVFAKAFESLPRYTPKAAPLAYFFTIARNSVIDHLRKKKPEFLEDFPEIINILPDTGKSLEERLNIEQDISHVQKVIETLSPEQREVIVLKFFKELTNREIADILGKSEEAVRQLQCRALKLLRAELIQKRR